jgi:hypothetical protein
LDANKFDIFSYMNNQPEINTHSYAELVDNSVSYQPLEQSYTQELQEYPEHPCKNCACCRAYQNLGDINHALSVQVMIFVTVITYTTAIL